MPEIFIIAGPPGVGKTTMGSDYIDAELDMLNEDEMRFKYKERGYVDYHQQAIFSTRQIVRRKIIANEDFALELNLGYQAHYDYVINAKMFSWENRLNILLFFTDSLQLCLDQADERYKSGRHLVLPDTIREMYANTLPLLKANFASVDHLRLIDVSKSNGVSAVAEYSKEAKELKIRNQRPNWFQNELKPFIEQYLAG